MKQSLFLVIIILILGPSTALAHGIQYETTRRNAVVFIARYDDGNPMSYARVTVFSPDNKEVEFQNGRSDRTGAFAFVPDRPGTWEIVYDDETGHGFKERIVIQDCEKLTQPSGERHFPRSCKLITGISVLWGLTGMFYFLKARQKLKSGAQERCNSGSG